MKPIIALLLTLNLYAMKVSEVLTIQEIMTLAEHNYTDEEIVKFAKMSLLLKQNGSQKEAAHVKTDTKVNLKEYCIEVNLKSHDGRRLLDACFMIEPEGKDYIVTHNLIKIMSSKTLEEVSSKKGKEKIIEQIQSTLKVSAPIYITKFKIESGLPR